MSATNVLAAPAHGAPDAAPTGERVGLRRFSKFVVLCVLGLIFKGALVTSNNAGLAVPDWPTSFGENMFLFHPSKWIGIIFYEHVHRLLASFIGMLMIGLTVWVVLTEKRSWVRYVTYAAMFAVVLQGMLGGLTVIYKLPLLVSSAHGVLGQTFFLLTIVIAWSLSREYQAAAAAPALPAPRALRWSIVMLIAIYIQLILGALMRHAEAGLAFVDFPTMAGAWLPSLSAETVAATNEMRRALHLPAVDTLQMLFHLLHRAGAFVVLGLVIAGVVIVRRTAPLVLQRSTAGWIGGLIVVQFLLGVLTLLSVRHHIITSLHVMTGAALLGVTMLLILRLYPVRRA